MKLRILSVVFIALVISACSSQERKVAYFEKHPDQVQTAAIDCVKQAQAGKNIEKNATCMAVVQYEQTWCEKKHQEGALFYLDYDCKNKVQMMELAMAGY